MAAKAKKKSTSAGELVETGGLPDIDEDELEDTPFDARITAQGWFTKMVRDDHRILATVDLRIAPAHCLCPFFVHFSPSASPSPHPSIFLPLPLDLYLCLHILRSSSCFSSLH